MKKVLLLMTALACMLGAQAADYYYSHTAKYKALDSNILTNGNFATGTDGWTNENGETVSADYWSTEPGTAPDGTNSVMSMDGSEGAGNALTFTQELSAGTYIVSYFIKAEGDFTSSITAGAANYIDIFTNADGSLTKGDDAVQVATTEAVGSTWTQVVSMVNMTQQGYLVFMAQRLATGTMMAQFEVRQVTEVFDTRILERLMAYGQQLLAEPALTEGRSDMEELIEGFIKPTLADPEQNEDINTMQGIIEGVEEAIKDFMDANGTDLIANGTLKDWSSWTDQMNYAKLATKDQWTFEGGRWGFTANTDYLEFSQGDGFIASAGIQTGYMLNATVRTRANMLDDLGPGTYFFAIEAQAVAASNRANPYGADYSVPVVGPTIFVGETSDSLQNDTLSGYHWKTYYKIAEIKEGEELKVGFHFPLQEGKKGGRYSVRNPKVYLIGVTADEAEFNQQKNAFIVQQYNLGLRLANYPVELADYPWEKQVLTDAIAQAQPVYDASLLIIDADGNVLDRSQVTAEKTQELLDEVNNLGRARNTILTANAPIDALKEAVAAGNAALNSAANANADAAKRTALQDAVNVGQALLDGISEQNQGEEFTAAVKAILDAKEEFESTSASRANPAAIQIENGDFSEFANNNNITTFDAPTKGWNWQVRADAARWEIRDNETLSQGHGASIWRGTTVQLDGKAWQNIELTYEGLYEYRAEAYISEERIGELLNAAEIIDNGGNPQNDTIYTPNIRLFFGEYGTPDSITVSKCYLGVKADGSYFTRDVSGTAYPGMVYATYSVFFKKEGTAATNVEFGLEAIDNAKDAGANGFGFGNNRIYYLGKEDQYLTDTKADVNAAVAKAKETAANNADSYWTVKLNRYIANAEAATTAKEMQNALHGISETSSRINGFIDSVKGVVASDSQSSAIQQGVFTLSGTKVAGDTQHLKAGIYIANGKKIIIR